MPTAIDIAGVDMPENLDGVSFLPSMEGKPYSNGREEVYCVFDRHFTVANQRMIRTKTHQFTFNSGDPGELYDLGSDPYQLKNVYGDPSYESVRKDLMARMDKYMTSLNDPLYRWYGRIQGAY